MSYDPATEEDEETDAEDGNVQDMPVMDKNNPALAATQEVQMATLEKVIVPPGAYTDPSNPAGAAGSVNMQVTTHPGGISEDYAADVEGSDDVYAPIDTHSLDMEAEKPPEQQQYAEEDRSDWKKADWQAKASEYGLPTSGNMDEIIDRVEEYEAEQQEQQEYDTATDDSNA